MAVLALSQPKESPITAIREAIGKMSQEKTMRLRCDQPLTGCAASTPGPGQWLAVRNLRNVSSRVIVVEGETEG